MQNLEYNTENKEVDKNRMIETKKSDDKQSENGHLDEQGIQNEDCTDFFPVERVKWTSHVELQNTLEDPVNHDQDKEKSEMAQSSISSEYDRVKDESDESDEDWIDAEHICLY